MTSTTPSTPDTGPEVTLSDNGVSFLLKQRLLDPPSAPGFLASLDNYDILRVLGVGGMGLVFLARDVRNQRQVAVKVIQPDLVTDQRSLHRFLIEARHMQQLSHPNILQVLNIQDRSDGPYFVTPYMQRGSVARLLQVGEPLDPDIVRRIAAQIGEALRHAHSRGILHRDLKPANILLDDAGDAYLADFGLLRRFYDDSIVDASRTSVEGTAPYLSPVAAAGKAEDTRGDIYAWGALVYEMLTGSPPYRGESSSDVIDQILAGPPHPILDRKPDLPVGLVRIVDGAMARELRDRYATMDDVLADLERLTQDLEPLGPNGHAVKHPSKSRRTWQWWAFALCALLGALLLAKPSLFQLRAPLWQGDTEHSISFIAPMPDTGIHTTPPQTLLFEDRFNGSRIDPDLWHWGQKDFSYQGLGDANHGQVSQRNGSLLLSVSAKSQNGWSSARAVWVDTSIDLNTGKDVLVWAKYSASGQRGVAQILIDGINHQTELPDNSTAVIVEHKADEFHRLDGEYNHLEMLVHSASRSALIKSTTTDPSEFAFRVIDLSPLNSWHLRFMVTGSTSSGFAEGDIQMRLDNVRATLPSNLTCAYGRVLDVDTGYPIRDALICGPDGHTCRTDGRGVYVLPIQPEQQVLLTIGDSRFKIVKDTPVVYAQMGEQVELDLIVRRAEVRFGDAIQTISPPEHDTLSAVDASAHDVAFVSGGGNQSALYHMDMAGNMSDQYQRFPDVTGLIRVGEVIFGVSHWPGQLYRFSEADVSPQIYPLATPWPRGLGYDGTHLWTLNAHQTDNIYEVWALDPMSGSVVKRFSTADSGVRSITWGGGYLWVGSRSGVVYQVDPQKAVEDNSLESGVVNQFYGVYECLSASKQPDELWAIDAQGKHLIRISIKGDQ